jgi:hypothetical protein
VDINATLQRPLETFGLKQLVSIALLLFVVSPSIAMDFTYREYVKASEDWKRGFVFGMAQYMSAVAQPDEASPYPVRNAYQKCLAASTDELLVRRVESYVTKNPASAKEPMVRVVIRALFDLCQKMPKPSPQK